MNQERTIEEDRKRPGGLTRRTFFKTAVAGAAFTVAAFMTALMFVRPGDLYDNPIDLDIPSFVLEVMFSEEDSDD